MRITIEVYGRATRFDVEVRAEGTQRALSIVAARYPEGEAWVRFPINLERFFVRDPGARAKLIEHDPPERTAA